MSVLPMKRITLYALKKDRKKILESLQRLGCVEIRDTLSDDEVFSRQDKSQYVSTFRKNAAQAERALEVLNEHAPADEGLLAALSGRKVLSTLEYESRVAKRDETVRTVQAVLAADKAYNDAKGEIPKLESQLVALKPWMNYDLPMDFGGTKSTAAFTGSLPGELSLDEAEARIREGAPDVDDLDVNLISASPEQTCIFVLCGRKNADKVRDALRRINFAKPPLSGPDPQQAVKDIHDRIEELEKAEADEDEAIRGYAESRDDIRFAVDYFNMRADKYEVISGLAQSRRLFVISGWVCGRDVETVRKATEGRYDCLIETEDPAPEDDPPALLRNNGFAEPVEGVVESYSLPNKHEFDPTFLVSLSYYLLFGLMLGDAGYGIIMIVACGIVLAKFKNMEPGLKRSIKMFLYCGISTTFWGFIFGSFFGDAVSVIADTFFGRPDVALKPIWFSQMDDPMKTLVFCFIVGIIHLFVGLGAKAYMDIRDGQILDALYDVGFWAMLVLGAIAYLLTLPMMANMLGVKQLSASVGKVAGIIAIIGAVGIILTGGRESRNWFKRILKGLYAVYGITSWLSDILSYSRLLALGLATGVIAQVFNKMGSMVAKGNGVIGVILFIVIFLIGHVLNLLINAMGAYVHSNRLEYVEFFGKFYDGGGQAFAPFKQNTKYFKIKEEI